MKIISEATAALIYQKAEGFADLKMKFATGTAWANLTTYGKGEY